MIAYKTSEGIHSESMPAQMDCFLFPLSHVKNLGFLIAKERGVTFLNLWGTCQSSPPGSFMSHPARDFNKRLRVGERGMTTLTRSTCSQLGTVGPQPPVAGWCFSVLISDFFLSVTNQEGAWKGVARPRTSRPRSHHPPRCFSLGYHFT